MIIPRAAEGPLVSLARGFYVVSVTGPRQSGKTTIVRRVFPDKPYVSLENPNERAFAWEDPQGFLARFPNGAVLDEVQRAPDLLSYLQGIVDEARRPGLFILTGSNQFHLISHLTQSLAGRVGLLRLLPLSLSELRAAKRVPADVDTLLYQGLFPPIYDRDISPAIWYTDYVATYLERDVRQMVNVRDLLTFQRFVGLVAAATGQLLNLARLAADTGVALNTAKGWLAVLEASYLVHRLPPFHRNLGKRLVKSPKVYFLDPGLAAWFMGIRSPGDVARHPQRGALFESWAIGELLKSRFNRALASDLSFFRDQRGLEVDAVLGLSPKAVPVEIKSALRVSGDDLKPLLTWRHLADGTGAEGGWLIYGGDEAYVRSDCRITPWREVPSITF